MLALRLSAVFLAVAAVSAGVSLGSSVSWDPELRGICLGALVAFVVSFLVGLDRTALVRR